MRGILIYAIYTFGEILSTALVVRAIMSWFTQPNNYSTLGKIYLALIRFTEPIVAPCRQFYEQIQHRHDRFFTVDRSCCSFSSERIFWLD